MWVARDFDGMLYAFQQKPYKEGEEWNADSIGYHLPKELFPEVKWEDKEPTKIKLIKVE